MTEMSIKAEGPEFAKLGSVWTNIWHKACTQTPKEG